MSEQHVGERMKAVTVYELMLMKERRDEYKAQRDELLDALKTQANRHDSTCRRCMFDNCPCGGTSVCTCGAAKARAAIEKAS